MRLDIVDAICGVAGVALLGIGLFSPGFVKNFILSKEVSE